MDIDVKEFAMDPITLAIIQALGPLAKDLIKDAYAALKAAIAKRPNAKGVTEAIQSLEKKPGSEGRIKTLAEEVKEAGIDQDQELIEAAQKMMDLLTQAGSISQTSVTQTARDNALQIGTITGEVNIKK